MFIVFVSLVLTMNVSVLLRIETWKTIHDDKNLKEPNIQLKIMEAFFFVEGINNRGGPSRG